MNIRWRYIFGDRDAWSRLALSPFLLEIVMNLLSENLRSQDRWDMLFTGDLVITAETSSEESGKNSLEG